MTQKTSPQLVDLTSNEFIVKLGKFVEIASIELKNKYSSPDYLDLAVGNFIKLHGDFYFSSKSNSVGQFDATSQLNSKSLDVSFMIKPKLFRPIEFELPILLGLNKKAPEFNVEINVINMLQPQFDCEICEPN